MLYYHRVTVAILAFAASHGLWSGFLDGFQIDAQAGFCSWKGFPTEFQGTYIGHKDSAKVVAQAKAELDPSVWQVESFFGGRYIGGAPADPCTIWTGRQGSIVEGWTVQVDWNWGPGGPAHHVKQGEHYDHAPGWTHASIHAPCRKDEVPRIRELYDYLFRRDER